MLTSDFNSGGLAENWLKCIREDAYDWYLIDFPNAIFR